jgi:HSP20 family protein
MALVHWQPSRDFGSLQQEVNRVFASFFDPPASGVPARWNPAMDLRDSGDAFVLAADLPGVSEEDIAIDVEGDVLSVSGSRSLDRTSDDGGAIRTERAFGTFQRRLTLPEGVDPERIEASFDRGVLEVRIPKPEQARPRRVSVQIGDRPKTLDAADGGSGSAETGADGSATERQPASAPA